MGINPSGMSSKGDFAIDCPRRGHGGLPDRVRQLVRRHRILQQAEHAREARAVPRADGYQTETEPRSAVLRSRSGRRRVPVADRSRMGIRGPGWRNHDFPLGRLVCPRPRPTSTAIARTGTERRVLLSFARPRSVPTNPTPGACVTPRGTCTSGCGTGTARTRISNMAAKPRLTRAVRAPANPGSSVAGAGAATAGAAGRPFATGTRPSGGSDYLGFRVARGLSSE